MGLGTSAGVEDSSTHVTRNAEPSYTAVELAEVSAQARGDMGPNANLAQLLGEGETTYFLNARPSNAITLAGGVGTRTEITFENNGKWPLLLKAMSMAIDGQTAHLDWMWQLERGDGTFPVGQGFHHARNLSGVGVPLLLGNGMGLGHLNELTLRFHNLSVDPVDIITMWKALQVANPEQMPVGGSLLEQSAALNVLAVKWRNWKNVSPSEQGLGMQLLRNGRFYTFPLQRPIIDDVTNPRFGAVDMSVGNGPPIIATFRNETGGIFIWEAIVYTSTTLQPPLPLDPFTWSLETGSGSWRMTQGAVDSRTLQGGRNAIGQWVPIHNPRPWIIKNRTTVQVNLGGVIPGQPILQPGVWFEAVGTLIGGNRL